MGRKAIDSGPNKWGSMILLFLGIVSCTVVYLFMSSVFRPTGNSKFDSLENLAVESEILDGEDSGTCCRGISNLELWGPAVKWGTDFKFNSSEECCRSCKAMCTGNDGPCLCDSWVFCGDKEACGSQFGECWLKKQKDTLAPDRHEKGNKKMWTSGLVFGKGEGIIGMETEHGTLHIKLLPECSPHSVFYILELLSLRHCAGCEIYRAESRGQSWDSHGNHIKNASFGPPFALIQGILNARGADFNNMPTEFCATLRRGSVAWIGSGPEFFISLANHVEWKKSYTVFGSVLPEDMVIAEKIAQLPTKSDVWNNINVAVLEKPIPLLLRRMKSSQEDLNLSSK
ncbi:hypothetical protein ACH5RR_038838 [Cinchona calisaya]|uniref:PPIase cyclophilin-type domain-containing protein n=1 Tax=Cinchona calisaya TaxID=153742 RepID=A0ABD2XZG8_9GENT